MILNYRIEIFPIYYLCKFERVNPLVMKKIAILPSLILILSMVFMFSSCEDFDLFGDDDDCDKDKMETISLEFELSVQIKYKDGQPFDGKTEFEIIKERCDESQTGYQKAVCISDGNGIYTCNIDALYFLRNKRDKVTAWFTAYHTPFYPPAETTEVAGEDFNYAKAKSLANDDDEVIKMYSITIPTNADGTE